MSSLAFLLVAVSGLTGPLAEWQVTAGYAVFAVSYIVFALGKLPGMKIDRPGMAIIGAVLMVAFRIVPAAEALRFIDFGTLVLLFSMMLVVGYLHLTGFFEWVTEQIVTRLKPHHAGGGKGPQLEVNAIEATKEGRLAMSLITPESIQKLQTALHAKAKI